MNQTRRQFTEKAAAVLSALGLEGCIGRSRFLLAEDAPNVPPELIGMDAEKKKPLEPVTSIDPEMEALGFFYREGAKGDHRLMVPAVELSPKISYNADRQDIRGKGYFTRIDFDPKTLTAIVETSEGMHATFSVDPKTNTVRTVHKEEGKLDIVRTFTYIDSPVARETFKHIVQMDHYPHDLKFNRDDSVKRVGFVKAEEGKDKNTTLPEFLGQRFTHETVYKLPMGINLEQYGNFFFKIHDTKNVGFSKEKDAVLIYFDDDVYGNYWHFMLGNEVLYKGPELEEGIWQVTKNEVFSQEYDKRQRTIKIGNNEITVNGPNREGFFELASGKAPDRSSLYYDPDHQDKVILGRNWNIINRHTDDRHTASEVLRGNYADGRIFIRDTIGNGYITWQIDLNYFNKDPNKSYRTSVFKKSDNVKLIK